MSDPPLPRFDTEQWLAFTEHADRLRPDQWRTYLRAVTAADSTPATRADLTTLDTEIPEYTMLTGEAKADNRDGLPVGASYLQEASYLMRSRLLTAAGDLYQQESARLASSYAQATGLPVVAIVVAVMCGALLVWAQRWLAQWPTQPRAVIIDGGDSALMMTLLAQHCAAV